MNQAKAKARQERLLPGGIPRYIHCYDNGGRSADRYTVVFTGRYRHLMGGQFYYLAMSSQPFHPQGVGLSGSSQTQIDYPMYSHIGKKIGFDKLPPDCKKAVVDDYIEIWSLSHAS
jgi:hypothetical protein